MTAKAFLHVVSVEWLKTRRRPFDRYLALAVLSLAAALPLRVALAASHELPATTDRAVEALLGPAGSLQSATSFLQGLVHFVAPLLAASTIGTEYALGTWAVLFLHSRSRCPHLFAKVCVFCVWVSGLMIAAVLTWVVVSVGCLRFLFADSKLTVLAGFWVEAFGRMALIVMSAVFYGLFAMLASTGSRSSLAGAAAAIILPSLLVQLSMRAIDPFMPRTLLATTAAWLGASAASGAPRGGGTILTSVVLLLGYMVAMIGAGAYILRRQEFA